MMKILVTAMMLVLLAGMVSAADVVLLQEDFETGYDGWTVFGGDGVFDVTTDDSYSYRRSCPGDFSACGGDGKNDYFEAEDDAGIKVQIDASQCSQDAVVTFWTRTRSAGSGDDATFSYSLTGLGQEKYWLRLVERRGDSWVQYAETIPGSAGTTFYAAFWLNDGEGDYGLFDDIEVTCAISDDGGDPGQPGDDIPEFTTIGAALALAGAGFVIWRKKR